MVAWSHSEYVWGGKQVNSLNLLSVNAKAERQALTFLPVGQLEYNPPDVWLKGNTGETCMNADRMQETLIKELQSCTAMTHFLMFLF